VACASITLDRHAERRKSRQQKREEEVRHERHIGSSLSIRNSPPDCGITPSAAVAVAFWTFRDSFAVLANDTGLAGRRIIPSCGHNRRFD
jgi:hypothetical protein